MNNEKMYSLLLALGAKIEKTNLQTLSEYSQQSLYFSWDYRLLTRGSQTDNLGNVQAMFY